MYGRAWSLRSHTHSQVYGRAWSRVLIYSESKLEVFPENTLTIIKSWGGGLVAYIFSHSTWVEAGGFLSSSPQFPYLLYVLRVINHSHLSLLKGSYSIHSVTTSNQKSDSLDYKQRNLTKVIPLSSKGSGHRKPTFTHREMVSRLSWKSTIGFQHPVDRVEEPSLRLEPHSLYSSHFSLD